MGIVKRAGRGGILGFGFWLVVGGLGFADGSGCGGVGW